MVRHGLEVDHLRAPQAPLVQAEQEVGVAVVLEYADLLTKVGRWCQCNDSKWSICLSDSVLTMYPNPPTFFLL